MGLSSLTIWKVMIYESSLIRSLRTCYQWILHCYYLNNNNNN